MLSDTERLMQNKIRSITLSSYPSKMINKIPSVSCSSSPDVQNNRRTNEGQNNVMSTNNVTSNNELYELIMNLMN